MPHFERSLANFAIVVIKEGSKSTTHLVDKDESKIAFDQRGVGHYTFMGNAGNNFTKLSAITQEVWNFKLPFTMLDNIFVPTKSVQELKKVFKTYVIVKHPGQAGLLMDA